MMIRLFTLLVVLLAAVYQVSAQLLPLSSKLVAPHTRTYTQNHANHNCGTEASPEDIVFLRKQRIQFEETERVFLQNYENRHRMPLMQVPIQVHIVRPTNGAGGLTLAQLNTAVIGMNNHFMNANLEFIICGINYIDDSTYYDFNTSDQSTLTSANDAFNVINIYFFNSITSGNSGFCGYTNFPNANSSIIMMANGCATNGSTLSHEMGHFYALYHTHGKTNTGTTDELVDGSNCATHGDDVCDTQADPNLSGLVNTSCQYTGTGADINGDTYVPDPNNIMSYSRKACRTVFTPAQYARINSTAINSPYRNRLNCPSPNDGGITSILSPQNHGSACGSPSTPEVVLYNFGTDTLTSVTINYQIDNGTIDTILWTGSLASYTSLNLSLPMMVFPIVNYTFKVYTSNPNTAIDVNNNNDTSSVMIQYEVTQGLPYSEAFDLGTIPTDIHIFDETNDRSTWTYNNAVSGFGTGVGSMSMNNYPNSTTGELDWILIPIFDLTNQANTLLTFDVAYAQYNANLNDTLLIVVRDSCNASYSTIYEKGGVDLATAPDIQSVFVPTAMEWRTDTIDLSAYSGSSWIRLAFLNRGGYGNVVYLDNINIVGTCNLTATATATNLTCNGATDGIATVTGLSGAGTYDFIWSDGQTGSTATNLGIGIYSVTASDINGCFATAITVITEPTVLTATAIDNGDGSGTVSALGGSPGYTYQWGANANNQTTATATNLNNGIYDVTITDANGCTVVSTLTMVVVGVNDIAIVDRFDVIPNPNKGQFTIQVDFEQSQDALVQVSDVLGRTLREFHFDAERQTITIDMRAYGSSVYFVVLRTPEETITKKVVIKK